MNNKESRFVIAYDASCGACKEVSDVVRDAGDGKLEILSLSNSQVRRWRTEKLGEDAPWAPSLIVVRGEHVRVWMGWSMALPLVRRLGIVSTYRVVGALGELQEKYDIKYQDRQNRATIGRKQFFRFGLGATVAVGLLARGIAPATAATRSSADMDNWIAKNQDVLPQDYDAVVSYPMAYRKAIYGALPPEVRSQLWVEQITRYRNSRGDLTPTQSETLDRALVVAGNQTVFSVDPDDRDTAFFQPIEELRQHTIASFGQQEADSILGNLAAANRPSAEVPNWPGEADCNCSTESDYCSDRQYQPCSLTDCAPCVNSCTSNSGGCGTLWTYCCNGYCPQSIC